MATNLKYTTPGLDEKDAERVVELLQDRLYAANDLHLTLKHVHWNVVGPHFIAVHEMLDPQVEEVRGFADDLAERIATRFPKFRQQYEVDYLLGRCHAAQARFDQARAAPKSVNVFLAPTEMNRLSGFSFVPIRGA